MGGGQIIGNRKKACPKCPRLEHPKPKRPTFIRDIAIGIQCKYSIFDCIFKIPK